MAYTTTSEISAELGGYTINESSTPSSTVVSGWITEAEAYINERTGMIFSSNAYSNEYYDYDGSGFLKLNKNPIISITKLEYEANGLDSDSDNWITLTEGRRSTNSYIIYKEDGEIEFHGVTKPTYGYQNIRVSYTAGYATVPYYIKRLTTLIVAKRVIMSVLNSSASEVGGSVSVGTISVSDPSAFGHNHIKSMTDEINDLFKTCSLKNYNITRNYNY